MAGEGKWLAKGSPMTDTVTDISSERDGCAILAGQALRSALREDAPHEGAPIIDTPQKNGTE